MKKLANPEIDQLFHFTKKHYVEFYDVQVELVDHLTSAIEEQWKESPNLTFEEALQIEFKKFGIFGFTGLVEEKQTQLHKYYNKILWQEVLKFVSLPKVIVTLLLYLGIYFLIKSIGTLGEIIALGVMALLFTYFMIDGFRFIFKIKKEQKKQGKCWLIQSVAQTVFSIPTIGIGGGYFSFFGRFFEQNLGVSNAGTYFLTTFLVFQTICMFVFYNVIKPSLNKSIQDTENKFRLV